MYFFMLCNKKKRRFKVRKLKIWTVLIALLLVFGSNFYVNHIQSETDRLYPDKPIHVFFEAMATQPAFLGMIDMLQLPKDEKKIFIWHRFLNRKDLFDLKSINAIELPQPKIEGFIYTGTGSLLQQVKEELKKSPKSPLIIYTNTTNYQYLFGGFLKEFPKEQIKHIHLYEDGLGILFSSSNYLNSLYFTHEDVQDFYNYYYKPELKAKLPDAAKYMFHTILPVTYHFFGFEKAKELFLTKYFFIKMKGASFEDIDFNKLNKKLSDETKADLYKMAGFDYEKYSKIFQEKKVFMFFGGFYIGGGNHLYQAEFNYVKELQKKYPDHHFFFKPHPSYSAFDRERVFKDVFDDVELVPAQIPYELFIIAGLVPDKISGRASSLFFTLDNDRIESYIPHGGYSGGLKLLYGFDTKKAVNINQYVPEKPLFFESEIVKDGKRDYLIIVDDKSVFLYNERIYLNHIVYGDNSMFCQNEGNCFRKEIVGNEIQLKKVDRFVFEHRQWTDTLVAANENTFCRLKTKDCGSVTREENGYTICWKKWGCESFILQPNGTYKSDKK